MARNPSCTVYIGNLNEKVSEKVLYEVLIQAGYLVDLHIPWDKETNRRKGYAFAQYETEEVAAYAVRLFSSLVRLHNRTLKFVMSGQVIPSEIPSKPSHPLPKPHPMKAQEPETISGSSHSRVSQRVIENTHSSSVYNQAKGLECLWDHAEQCRSPC